MVETQVLLILEEANISNTIKLKLRAPKLALASLYFVLLIGLNFTAKKRKKKEYHEVVGGFGLEAVWKPVK